MSRVRLSALLGAALALSASPASLPVSDPGLVSVPAPQPQLGDGATRPSPVADRSCKPHGPLEVALTQAESSLGSRVDLDLDLQPLRDMISLRWELSLPADAWLMEGALQGDAAAAHGMPTSQRVSVGLPVDQRARRATLTVHGVFLGSDETGASFEEPVTVVKHLSWGEVPPPAPLRFSRDAETGDLTTFVSLPTAHREGR
jgi:hypothetical protein